MKCSISNCSKKATAKSLCNTHYQRQRLGLSMDLDDPIQGRGRPIRDPVDRFLSKIKVTGDCWRWTAYTKPDGYARFYADGKQVPAHRWSFERWICPIPKGLELHHVCNCSNCVNPHHLVPITPERHRAISRNK